MLGKVTK